MAIAPPTTTMYPLCLSMLQVPVHLPFLVVSDALEGYKQWASDNREILEWIMRVEVLQREHILCWRATEVLQSCHEYWALLPSLHQWLSCVFQTFQAISEVDPAFSSKAGLGPHEVLLWTLARATSRDWLDMAWSGFQRLLLSFGCRLLEHYQEAVQALQQHIEVVTMHEIIDVKDDVVLYAQAIIQALSRLAEENQFADQDRQKYLKFKSYLDICVNLCS
ncbi:hypothetical protein JAAARDRAFT_192465 [Jaapia argillacea MUCL 33604]|uniref:Uncharacterized protein n=1 Tax=Jaapia argillacea MUCL 33604 TaxID=933084 RepID=A0A067PVW9_9AGAM|nr:hypothetical protein JAAARDRAFT_192465 [Jaapia argillacea MUCL 33604]